MTEEKLPEESRLEEIEPLEGTKELHPGEEEIKDKKEKAGKPKHKKESVTDKLEEEIAQLNDKYLRLYSEYDNYRKRTSREKIELGKTAAGEVISAQLPVIDDLERAIRALEEAGEEERPVRDGILLIYNKWMNILSQQGLEPIQAMGEPFDTDLHEAVTNIPAPDSSLKGKVVDEIQKGYRLNGKVIRFAKVVVGI
jgi:molecular chaperone GrpE